MLLTFIGFLSGIIGGMGIGGGTILIPALIIFTSLTQKQAQGVNLISFLPVATIALITHIKNRNVKISVSLPLIAFGVFGAILGSFLAVRISSEWLRKIFGVFLFFMGIYEFFYKSKKHTQ